MTNKNISFTNLIRRAMMVATLCGVCGVARAANDGCDDENNNRITAELALCSTHVYNIGETENQTGANRQLMKDVIALKTTVITQQMEKQYEYMESMTRRLKTQLEKAVLTTKLQKAGAASGNDVSGGSYSSGGSYGGSGGSSNNGRFTGIYLDRAQNCTTEFDQSKVLDCLITNYSEIMRATNSGQSPSGEARQQLAEDFKILTGLGLLCEKSQNNECKDKTLTQPLVESGDEKGMYSSKCQKTDTMNGSTGFRDCLNAHNANIRNAKTAVNREERQSQQRQPY